MSVAVLWFRRDLRLGDNPALLAARDHAGEVLPLFVLDPRLRGPAGHPRQAFLWRCLRDLDEQTGGRLVVLDGDPAEVVPRVAREVDAAEVHVAADYGPYGSTRDTAVEDALTADGRALARLGSPYAVAPGRLRKADGTSYRVYTPYFRAWQAHGVRPPAPHPGEVGWTDGALRSTGIPADPDLGGVELPAAGERAAAERYEQFLADHVRGYAKKRNLPSHPGTSRLSAYLKYGCIHPRSLLAGLGSAEGEQSFRGELAWRDFYADVLFARPDSVREPLQDQMRRLPVDEGPRADERFAAWVEGRTGFPVVDAGMRQLRAEAWMHNRVRMITASFLVKDLHLAWQRGARYFMTALVDGDLASNHQGWQWVAGTGTDPAPYFRIFNPVTQGQSHDPDGTYIRRYVPELRDVAGKAVHEPWTLPGGPPNGYPRPIVDHKAERAESLARYAQARG